jgi:hypothetical protein
MLDPEDSSFRLWIERKGRRNRKSVGVHMILAATFVAIAFANC